MFASKFENLRMMENETINNFNFKLCDIINEAFAFGEKYSDATCEKNTKVST